MSEYTEEQLRKIDELVNDHVMGDLSTLWLDHDSEGSIIEIIPEYSKDISVAWEVVEKLDLLEDNALMKCLGGYGFFSSVTDNKAWVCAETVPLLVCLAALRAKGIDVEKELNGTLPTQNK